MIYNQYQSIFSNLFFYIGTLILNGIDSGLFFVLGGTVLLINWLAVVLYLRAERQMFQASSELCKNINNVLEDSIIGVDSIRSYNKTHKISEEFIDLQYQYNIVYNANNRWISQGLSIFSDMTGLAVTFGSAAFAIHNKIK
jgi:ABC-type multidrug transport system fused ATPase/permease subunit